MTQQVSLFRRGEQGPAQRNTSLFGRAKAPVQSRAETERSADTMKVAAALGAAQARMERLFATA